MTLEASTYISTKTKGFNIRSYCLKNIDINTSLNILANQLHEKTLDVIVTFNEPEIITNFTDKELTMMTSEMAEISFREIWENEDDDYWESYL